jgi:diguanylate cyclase (GGDEF)-like protein
MCDVDNFKSYNDIYGHQAGDLALRAVGAALLGIVRKSDGVYRYGGEEFLLMLPKQSVSGAKALMERALDAVRNLAIVHAGDPSGQLRLSAGISSFSAGHRVDADTLVGEADAALYAAKAAGRNRVELAR